MTPSGERSSWEVRDSRRETSSASMARRRRLARGCPWLSTVYGATSEDGCAHRRPVGATAGPLHVETSSGHRRPGAGTLPVAHGIRRLSAALCRGTRRYDRRANVVAHGRARLADRSRATGDTSMLIKKQPTSASPKSRRGSSICVGASSSRRRRHSLAGAAATAALADRSTGERRGRRRIPTRRSSRSRRRATFTTDREAELVQGRHDLQQLLRVRPRQGRPGALRRARCGRGPGRSSSKGSAASRAPTTSKTS